MKKKNEGICDSRYFSCCFARSVKILMADGSYRSVADIRIDDEVKGIDGINKAIANIYEGVEAIIFCVETKSGKSIRLTGSHVVSCSGKGKRVEMLTTEDAVDVMENGVIKPDSIQRIFIEPYHDIVYNFEIDQKSFEGTFLIANDVIAGDFAMQTQSVIE